MVASARNLYHQLALHHHPSSLDPHPPTPPSAGYQHAGRALRGDILGVLRARSSGPLADVECPSAADAAELLIDACRAAMAKVPREMYMLVLNGRWTKPCPWWWVGAVAQALVGRHDADRQRRPGAGGALSQAEWETTLATVVEWLRGRFPGYGPPARATLTAGLEELRRDHPEMGLSASDVLYVVDFAMIILQPENAALLEPFKWLMKALAIRPGCVVRAWRRALLRRRRAACCCCGYYY